MSLLAVGIYLAAAAPVQADSATLDLAAFGDITKLGSVLLTNITANSIQFDVTIDASKSGGVDILNFYFNVLDTDFSKIQVSSVSVLDQYGNNLTLTSGSTYFVTYDANNLHADGDGWFDVSLDFLSSSHYKSLSFTVTSTESITLDNFADKSSPTDAQGHGSAGAGIYYVAAHIQGTNYTTTDYELPFGTDYTKATSLWVGATSPPSGVVPLPGALLLLGAGLVRLAHYARRKN